MFAVVFLFVTSGLHATLAVAQTKYWKVVRWFIAGLLRLSLVAALVTVYAVWGPAPPPVR